MRATYVQGMHSLPSYQRTPHKPHLEEGIPLHADRPHAYTRPGVDARPADRTTPLPLAAVGDTAVARDGEGGRGASEAGLVVRKAPAEPLGCPRALAAVRNAPRAPRRGALPPHDLLPQRGFPMAAGAEEANAAHTRRHARRPAPAAPVASPPPRARCAPRVSRPALSRLARVLLAPWGASSDRPPPRLGLAGDAPEAPAPGEQEQGRDEGSEGGDGVLPRHVEAGLWGRRIPPICQATRCTGAQRLAVVTRLGTRRRHAGPETLLLGRGASHGAAPAGRPWSEEPPDRREGTGWTSQRVVTAVARAVGAQAQRAYAREGGKRTRGHAPQSPAGTGSRWRRVGLQGEGSAHGVHTRGVGTALEPARPQGLSPHRDCARGQADHARTAPPRSRPAARPACHRCEAKPGRGLGPAAAAV